jgi:uncharacterized delta-60 repeat protein
MHSKLGRVQIILVTVAVQVHLFGASPPSPPTQCPSCHDPIIIVPEPPPNPDPIPGTDCGYSIEGITFERDGQNHQYQVLENGQLVTYNANTIVPDCNGAAGPNHVVSVINRSIEWHTKDGQLVYSARLGGTYDTPVSSVQFFTGFTPPVRDVRDPRVVYDQHAGRFVVVVAEKEWPNEPFDSRILVAVSDDSDPSGTWYMTSINSKISIGGTDTRTDYPMLAVDEEAIYISAEQYGADKNFKEHRLWILAKNPFYSGGQLTVNVYNAFALAGLSSSAWNLCPAQVFGANGAGPNIGTYFVSTAWFNAGNDFVYVLRVLNPLNNPTFQSWSIDLGDIHAPLPNGTPEAPQKDSNRTINTIDHRAMQAVWRSDRLYFVHHLNPPTGIDAGQSTAHWCILDTTQWGTALPTINQGNISGETIAPGTHTYFPSLAVDKSGNVGIGFSASSSTKYVGAYFTSRAATDANGVTGPPAELAEGMDVWVRLDLNGRNRWGDYTGGCIDPSNDTTMWFFNQYALTQFPGQQEERGRYGTRWGCISYFPPGNRDAEFNSSGVNGTVEVIARQADGKILIGGSFTQVNGIARPYLARLDENGSTDLTFNASLNGMVQAIAIQSDGKILVGGSFSNGYGGTITRLNSDGTVDPSFASHSMNSYNSTFAIAIQSDGKIYLGGSFTQIQGYNYQRVARLHPNGVVDTGFNPNQSYGLDNTVYTLAIQSDGKLLLGGSFTIAGGLARNRVARLNSDGSGDSTFNPGTGANSNVETLLLLPDGKILIGGSFTTFSGVANRNRLGRLDANGAWDSTFNLGGTGPSGSVYSLVRQSNGRIVVGGTFTLFNGSPQNRLLRLNATGSFDPTFNIGAGASGVVFGLGLQADGKVLVGGAFAKYDNITVNRIVRVFGD